MKVFFSIGLVLYTISAFLPLWKTDNWFVRFQDFPRLQFSILGLIFLVGAVVLGPKKTTWHYLVIISALIGLALDIYRLYPYSPLSPVESKMSENSRDSFSILTLNVFQENQNIDRLKDLISNKSPDLIFLFEVDEEWVKRIKTIPGYQYRDYHPLNNTYGLAFLSRKPVDSIEVNYLVEKDVPSYQIKFRPSGKDAVTIFGVHPKPPLPSQSSSGRDAELVLIGKKSREVKTSVLVVGDMNDVAWSHTTRLFRRISGLLDPRIGRSPFPTFPAAALIFRFPLDYIFHSKDLGLVSIEIQKDVGSDHLPLMATFVLNQNIRQENRENPDQEDFKEAQDLIKREREKPND